MMERGEADVSVIEVVLDSLQSGADDDVVLSQLAAAAPAFVSSDRIHLLVPYAGRLATLDYSGHMWAALPAGVAICSIDRPRGRVLLRAGREHLEAVDPDRAAFAWFLEGLQDLGEGDLERATIWWRRAQTSLDPTLQLARLTLAHLALGAYAEGDLRKAIVLAEEALWGAMNSVDPRAEAVASIYLCFFHLYTGKFARVEQLSGQAELAFGRIPEGDRYELPLLNMERGAVAVLRGDAETGEREFAASIGFARRCGNEWYEAIGLVARAEFTAPVDPARALADARQALGYLDPIEETWWSHWARLAVATAHLHRGQAGAGMRVCRDLLVRSLNPLERGRTLLLLCELHTRVDAPLSMVVQDAEDALELLLAAGADFWAARTLVLLARADPTRAELCRQRAGELAGADADDAAWQRLFHDAE